MAEVMDIAEMSLEDLRLSIVDTLLEDLVNELPSVSHHTGAHPHENGYASDLVLAHPEMATLPGFDMRHEGIEVAGQMRGHLLDGPKSRRNRRGELYNVIPLNPSVSPGPFHQEFQKDLYLSANMLAEKAGVDAAMRFLLGQGEPSNMVYEWQRERYAGRVGDTVYRTVKENQTMGSWWYPPTQAVSPASLEKAMKELEAWGHG